MPNYRSRPDVEMLVDVSTGDQTVHTPWGIISARAGDMMVPHGDRTVPIPGALWQRWFEVPVVAPPAKPKREWPDAPFAEWLRRELEEYAVEVIGEEPPHFPRKGELAKWIEKRRQAAELMLSMAPGSRARARGTS